MIKYNPKNWFSSILAFRRSDTFLIIWKEMIYIFLFTLALTYFELRMEMNTERWGKLLAVY